MRAICAIQTTLHGKPDDSGEKYVCNTDQVEKEIKKLKTEKTAGATALCIKVLQKTIDSRSYIIYNIFIRKILNNVCCAHPDSFCHIFQMLIK